MTSSQSVWNLVHALTQSEKRYVKLYAARHSLQGETQYGKLFDLLNAAEAYDEQMTKRKMEAHGCKPHNFASLKNFLQDMILQAMREFHRDAHPHQVVRDLLENVRFLQAKGLGATSLKALQKAKDLALRYEAFDLQLQIAEVESDIMLNADGNLAQENLKRYAVASEAAITALQKQQALKKVTLQLYYRARRNYVLRDEEEIAALESIKKDPLIHAQHTSFTLQYLAARCSATLAQLAGDAQSHLTFRRTILQLWETHPHMKDVMPSMVGTSIANFLGACRDANVFFEMPNAIAMLEAIDTPKNTMEYHDKINNASYYRLLHGMNTCNWEAALPAAKTLKDILAKPETISNKARLFAIRYNLAIFYFFTENFKETQAMFNAILNEETSRHREDVQQASRLFLSVVYYEREYYDLLENALRSAKRYLNKKDKLYAFEASLIRTLQRLSNTVSRTERQGHLTALQKDLTHLRENPQNRDAPGLQEIQYWIESRIQGKALHEVIPPMD